jgi:asparagine synthetase B (glutamine-hydrolysing)
MKQSFQPQPVKFRMMLVAGHKMMKTMTQNEKTNSSKRGCLMGNKDDEYEDDVKKNNSLGTSTKTSPSISSSQEKKRLPEQKESDSDVCSSSAGDDDDDDDDNHDNIDARKPNSNSLHDDDNVAYLCWNGEVYQQRPFRRRHKHHDNHDDDDDDDDDSNNNNQSEDQDHDDDWHHYHVSDTVQVAKLLERAADKHPNNNNNNHNNMDISHDTDEDDMLRMQQQHTATIMASLYNAEYAFVVVTTKGVLFGRDVWGRRSFLQGQCRHCKSFHIASVVVPPPHDVTTATPNEKYMEWTEVVPGKIHAISFAKKNCLSSVDSTPIMTAVPAPHYPHLPILPLPPNNNNNNNNVSESMWNASFKLEYHLRAAIQMRMGHTSTGVLFSGGVDSVVLAALAAEQIASTSSSSEKSSRSLHLYTVSFGGSTNQDNCHHNQSADHRAALVSFQVLQQKHPHISLVFHDIVIPDWSQVCAVESHIRTLLHPKPATVMDINIATALWFAASCGNTSYSTQPIIIDHDDHLHVGVDHQKQEQQQEQLHHPRVLLLGMGADELLGGYGRHRQAFEKGGWDMLQNELQYDQDRLWERNLGRDDRLIADHGKEARFPFLDAHLVQFVHAQPLSDLCNFILPPGKGDKQILRLVAQRLGMDHASELVKRAIQFGSRISHMSDKERFGSRRQAKGTSKV